MRTSNEFGTRCETGTPGRSFLDHLLITATAVHALLFLCAAVLDHDSGGSFLGGDFFRSVVVALICANHVAHLVAGAVLMRRNTEDLPGIVRFTVLSAILSAVAGLGVMSYA